MPIPFIREESYGWVIKRNLSNIFADSALLEIRGWTFGKKLTFLIDGVMSYSFFPIRLLSYIGFLIAVLGFLYAFVIFASKIIWGNPVTGWAPIMIVSLMMGGFQMVMLGVIGEYLWRTLSQVRNRDHYVIEDIYKPKDQQDASER